MKSTKGPSKTQYALVGPKRKSLLKFNLRVGSLNKKPLKICFKGFFYSEFILVGPRAF